MKFGIQKFDKPLLWLGLLASFGGLCFIFDAGYARSLRDGYGPIPREFVMQAAFLIVAIVAGIWISHSRIQSVFNQARWLWWATILALVAVMIPGIGLELNGAHRWIKLGPVNFQPAEFAKLTVILYVALVLANRKEWPAKIKRQRNWMYWADNVAIPKLKRLWPAGLIAAATLLIVEEPDLGTGAIVAVIAYVMFAFGGVTRKSMVIGTAAAAFCCFLAIKAEPYRVDRIVNHMNRWHAKNVDDTGFQTVQAELGIASGSWLGVGIGAGRTKHIIPAPTTDFLPATIAEEFGFLGWLAVTATLAAITIRLYQLANSAPTKFGRNVLVGLGTWIGVQSVVNLTMANGTLPAIGIPLPFFSSGGSSLIALWLGLGVAAVAMQKAPAKEETAHAPHRNRWWYRRSRLSRA